MWSPSGSSQSLRWIYYSLIWSTVKIPTSHVPLRWKSKKWWFIADIYWQFPGSTYRGKKVYGMYVGCNKASAFPIECLCSRQSCACVFFFFFLVFWKMIFQFLYLFWPRCSTPTLAASWTPRRTRKCSRVSRAAWTRSWWITMNCHCRTNARTMQKWWDWQRWSWAASFIPMPASSSPATMEPLAQASPLVVSNRKYN